MSSARAVALTGRGQVRPNNEDAVLVFEWLSQATWPHVVELRTPAVPPLLCAVADGMGGHAAGELASILALAQAGAGYPGWTDVQTTRTGLLAVNAAVHHAASHSTETRGMGTTIAGVVLWGAKALCFNVGDSRVYRITDGYLEQLSVDDAVMSPDGRTTNRLTQALGDSPNGSLNPHVTEVTLEDDAIRFLLCTDGVSATLSPTAFRALCRVPDLTELVLGLRDAVYDAGAEDNLSIVALDAFRTENTLGEGEERSELPGD